MTITRPASSLLSTISMGVEPIQLRRRHHTLGNSNGNGAPKAPIITGMTVSSPDTDGHQTPTDYLTGSDSSEDDAAPSNASSNTTRRRVSPERPNRKPSPVRTRSSDGQQYSHSTRAWYQFDLSVILALVSPIGNWLTGGDHIKNLLLILLLVYYLHQIIEIPWSLYHTARPRRRADVLANGERKLDAARASELRFYELSFLALTVLSPFLGAILLRQITTAVIGANTISWFSTGLFVLATGIRPWRHFIDRVSQRAEELHDAIHYPPTNDKDGTRSHEMDRKMEEMASRLAILETAMTKMRGSVRDSREEQFEYVDDAMEGVQKVVKRIEKRNERQDERLQALESSVESLRKTKGKTNSKEAVQLGGSVSNHSILAHLIPRWLLPPVSRSPPPPSSPILRHSLRSFPSSPRLETIMEDEEAKPTYRYWSIPWVDLVFHWGDLATLPLRALLSYLFGRRRS